MHKPLNPNTTWLREAKWGLFTHYLVHMPSAPIADDMDGSKWNAKVNSFRVKDLADQFDLCKGLPRVGPPGEEVP